MAIYFTCSCGRELKARDENAGRSIRCPQCDAEVTIPELPPEEYADPTPARRPRPAKRRHDYDEEFEDEGEERSPSKASGKAIASLVCGILSFIVPCLPPIPAIILGILGLGDVRRGRGRVSGQGLAIAGIILGALALVASLVASPFVAAGLLIPAVQKAREAAARIASSNNLRTIGLAMHNHLITKGSYPRPAITDGAGKPLLSWRVALLPYLGEQQLYAQFKLDEAWDSPHNLKLLTQMPQVYAHPSANPKKAAEGYTYYQVFVGQQTLFPLDNKKVTILDVPDGTDKTLMVVEAADPVPWTKPSDLNYSANQPVPRLADFCSAGTNAAFADASVHFIPKGTPEAKMRAWITRNGNETVALPP
jgi:hypothetical protein